MPRGRRLTSAEEKEIRKCLEDNSESVATSHFKRSVESARRIKRGGLPQKRSGPPVLMTAKHSDRASLVGRAKKLKRQALDLPLLTNLNYNVI